MKMAQNLPCSVNGCGKTVRCKGLCRAHYERYHRYGDPLAGRASPGDPIQWIKDHAAYDRDECLTWPYGRDAKGYTCRIRVDGIMAGAHRHMCMLAHGPAPTPKHETAHSCGSGHHGCMNPRHLRWATRAENEADKVGHGTSHRGERSHKATLTESDVLEIRSLLASGHSQRECAAKFGVTREAISAIHTRKTWAWLAG